MLVADIDIDTSVDHWTLVRLSSDNADMPLWVWLGTNPGRHTVSSSVLQNIEGEASKALRILPYDVEGFISVDDGTPSWNLPRLRRMKRDQALKAKDVKKLMWQLR
jgi:hypothetical protein